MQFNILTIFPGMIRSYADESILGRGQAHGAIKIDAVDIRNFAEDKHHTTDDTPYGGGAGMVMKPEPIFKALMSLGRMDNEHQSKNKTILMSPRGRQFDQRMAEEFALLDSLTIVCGRYEGVDQRVADYMVDEEISVGPYVLAGGELGALVVTEAVSRLISGVLGNAESLDEETFSLQTVDNRGQKIADSSYVPLVQKEYPHYTKPASFNGWDVPEILLSGDHKKIEVWRKDHSL